MTTVREAVWAALGTVRDPELDRPITELGFVTEAEVHDGGARVRLRLPTYFCAPNFAYMMVADAHDSVVDVAGVTAVDVRLEDHFAAAEINAGVAAGSGFGGAFPGEAGGELAELRRTFQRKAHTACVERACRELIAAGWQVEALPEARLADLVPERRAGLLRRRAELGLPADPVLMDDEGRPVPPGQVGARLRLARTVRVSVEGNGAFCRSLLQTRYPEAGKEMAG